MGFEPMTPFLPRTCSTTELRGLDVLPGIGREWAVKDSNLRSLMTTDLQSVPFGHLGNRPGYLLPLQAYAQNHY